MYLFFSSTESPMAKIGREWPIDSQAQWSLFNPHLPWLLSSWNYLPWLPRTILFGSLPSPWLLLLSLLRKVLCSAHHLKTGTLTYHFGAGASHIHICSPVPSPALMSSTSDCFLDTLVVSLRYIKLQVFIVECIISLSSIPAPLPVSAAQLPTLTILRTSLRPGVILDSLHLSPSPYPDNCTSQVFL